MNITELISHLEHIRGHEGDLKCVVNVPNDYWGSTQEEITQYTILVTNVQPEGPKSGQSERCVIFSHY